MDRINVSKEVIEYGSIVYLGLAILFAYLGVYGGNTFMECDFITYGVSKRSEWTQSAGYDVHNFNGLLLQTYCLPIAGIFLLLFALHSFKSRTWNTYLKITAYIGIFIGAMIAAVRANSQYTGSILSCGFFCFGDTSGDSTSGFSVITGVIYFFVALIFAAMALMLIFRSFITLQKVHSAENDPLLGEHSHSAEKIIGTPTRVAKEGEKKRVFLVSIIVVFGLFFPFLLFAFMTIPDSWESMNTAGIATYAATVESQAQGRVWNWEWDSNIVLKLFPDILAFYLFLYFIVLVGIIAKLSPPFRLFLHKRPAFFFGLCIGEVSLILTFITMFWAEFGYWYHDHEWHRGESKTKAERAARTMGQLGNITLGLLLFPVSRNSIWSAVFGVPWEAALRFHRYLGTLLMMIVFIHICLWWKVYDQQGLFPSNIYKVPLDYNSDNFTINLTFLNTIAMFFFMGILSLPFIRRKQFEVFYYAHHFSLAVFIVVLWHATTSWCYILGGLLLYVFDRMIRFTKACSTVMVHTLNVQSDPAVVKLAYTIESGGVGPWSGKFTPLKHEAGQYCFINVPSISHYQWHPFTISSSPTDALTSHHIKSMGNNTWTDQLVKLARKFESEAPLHELVVNVDGPYGLPLDYAQYRTITLVAGGIGITPIIGIYSYLYSLAKSTQFPISLETVKLIWVVRDPRIFASFQEIFHSVASDSCGGKFIIDLYATNKDTESSGVLPHYKHGRPDLFTTLASLAPYSISSLVFACGPEQLMDDCANVTMQYGLDFRRETFEL